MRRLRVRTPRSGPVIPVPVDPGTEQCPYCEEVVPANDLSAQKAHMEACHPDVIEQRLTENGFTRLPDGTIHDNWASD